MTAPHSDRAHALWSASATARNWACSGALALGETVRQLDVESEAAAWGTACHELSEQVLRKNNCFPAADWIGMTIKTKQHSFEVDEEMAETAQTYVDYVMSLCPHGNLPTPGGAQLWIEERFSLAKLDPPFEAGGTCDAIVYNPDEKLLEVIDLKGGRGIKVDVNENKQLRTYALGAMLAHPDLDVVRVKSTIVQPRNGGIRSETFHVTELMEWTAELIERMERADEARAAMQNLAGPISSEQWGQVYLQPGDHCTFCPAAGVCPALEAKALKTADAFFNDSGKLTLRNQPDEQDPARLADILDGLDSLEEWIKAKRALANRLAETGVEIANPATGSRYYLADRFGHRKFKAGGGAADELETLGIDRDDYTVEKMASPAQVEKAIGKKGLKDPITRGKVTKTRGEWLADMIEKPKIGRTLVSAAKSDKQPAKGKAEAFFT